MSSSQPTASDRREFLGRIAVAASAAALLSGAGCASPLAAGAQGLTATPASGRAFDDSWTQKVSAAKHRAVFDSPAVEAGIALSQAVTYLTGYREMFPDSEAVAVVVLRHMGTVMAMNDALWSKYELGEMVKLKDPSTDAMAKRNPFIHVDKNDKKAYIEPEESLEALRARGVVLLVCNKALMGLGGRLAEKLKRPVDEVRAEFRAGLVPGVVLQPSGIYAVARAQEVGCSLIRST